MNQKTNVDNDLQKAIDDITKNTNDDPIFADPVATPAPLPKKNAPVTVAAPAKPPVAPAPIEVPELPTDPILPPAAPAVDDFAAAPAPVEGPTTPFVEGTRLDAKQVKEAALRDLAPILDKLDLPAEQRFSIYKTVIDDYHDTSVLEPAYHAATEIVNDRERGEALLSIVEAINKM